MAEEQKTVDKKTKKQSASEKATANKQEKADDSPKDDGADRSFLAEAAENIEAGAKYVGEKTPEVASDFASQTGKVAKDVFGKVKTGLTSAYETSSKYVQQAYHAAGDYAEKYKNHAVMMKLKANREKLYLRLGANIYEKFKVDQLSPDKVFEEDEVKTVLAELGKIDDEVVKLGEELDKS